MAEKKLNICLVSREYPPDTAFGGIATYSLDTAKLLSNHGHTVTVFSQSLSPSRILDLQGVKVHKIRIPRPFNSYHRLPIFIIAYNFMIWREVMRVHRAQHFDIIDAPDHLAEGLFSFLMPDVPLVTRLHTPYALIVDMGLNNYQKGLSYKIIKKFEGIALQHSSALYAPSMDLVRRCEQLFDIENIPLEIFGYPIDLDLFSPSSTAHETPMKRILFLGRLEQRKGIETMAAAFPQVVSRFPDATLKLVGNDTPNIMGYASGREYLQTKFTEAGCFQAVSFEGAVSLNKLPDLFHAHDIVWIPSLYDNFPLICLEAMACGKPVVVSDAGGLPEMIRHGNTGLVFKAGVAEELADHTSMLFSNPGMGERLGKNAREFCEQNYSENSVYLGNIRLYKKAISNLETRKK